MSLSQNDLPPAFFMIAIISCLAVDMTGLIELDSLSELQDGPGTGISDVSAAGGQCLALCLLSFCRARAQGLVA